MVSADAWIEDLLGRPVVKLDLTPVQADFQNRVILLTGAGGSIGSELARQIASLKPARLVLLDRSESDLYFLHLELGEAHPELHVVPVICDITNQNRLAQLYSQHRPEYVIHAAAYQHVALMDANVLEAVRNNVLGTLFVATMAVRYGAAKFLLVSTDRAIRPSTLVGATQRAAERIIFGLANLHRSGIDFRAVRFGNVLGSRGSVIPLLQRQVATGGPVRVMHPLAQSYFLTSQETAQLVLLAGSLPGIAGAIAMLEMGEPVRILDLAEKFIRLSGKLPGKDIQIVFSGLRPGENLEQARMSAREASLPTSSEKIRIKQTPEISGPELMEKLSQLFAALDVGDADGVLTDLCELVPECISPLRQSQTPPTTTMTRLPAELGGAVTDAAERRRREPSQLAHRPSEPVELRLIDRRNGVACRRKTPRHGGRRRTDIGALIAQPHQSRTRAARVSGSPSRSTRASQETNT
jgi:FlaA1/EpsC-like NDP-sugar epimerase